MFFCCNLPTLFSVAKWGSSIWCIWHEPCSMSCYELVLTVMGVIWLGFGTGWKCCKRQQEEPHYSEACAIGREER